MFLEFLKLLLAIVLACCVGKLVSKLKLPAILGWLIAGMILGPHAIKLIDQSLLDAGWYQTLVHILECAVGFFFNNIVMPEPVLNFMLIGMAFSAAFSNIISEERLRKLMDAFNPVLSISMVVVILNLGAPLDYHLILGAGLFTVIYIVSRAFGKYFGAFFGASVMHSSKTVRKYLGLTLLPHSGVSLVFTGIAVSVLVQPAPECAQIIQGTIAAAVINEIIAAIMAKKGFEWAGEFNKK